MSRPGIILENPRVAVAIDRQTGAVRSIHDKNLDVVYPQTGIGFEVETAAGTFRSEKAAAVKTKAGEAELSFTGNGLDVTLHYRLGAEDHFIEKWLEIRASDGKPYFLKSVMLEDVTTEAFSDIHFHDDQTIWHCPINLFLRAEKGGCFAGIEYPYWELEQNGAEGFRLGYAPNYQAAEGEVNVSEKYFIGVYRKEGINRVSQGPYPGRGRCKLLSWGGKCGLSQHFKGGIPNPVSDVPLEVLDWGEVWAMQEFMQHVLPDDLPLPEDGFWIWQNGWWAGLWKIEAGILDLLKQAGIHDVMTAHTWYGRGNHPGSPPYIDQMRIDPMGFPKDSGIAGLPGPAGPAAGLHANHGEVELDSFVAGEYTPELIMPLAMKALYDHGQKIGVHVSSFSLPGIYFKEKPEWASSDEDGKVSEYLFGRKVSCPACDPYMDHMLKLLDHVLTRYKPRWWGFDGRWLSYWEVPMYRPGPKGLGFDTCHAETHGHLPGDNLYKEWKNIQKLVREIRRRHPKMCLEQYLGLKRGGPWALRYFNCDDNYYETNGALMNRFQAWHNQNDRFRPVYKNYAAIFGGSPAAFRNNVISSISVTSYCQIGPGYADLALEENREFLKKWRAWATENYDYLKVKRDLFDSPGDSPVDGSAHIIKDRGFLFLFSLGDQAARASIPINRWLQLEENADALYQIKEVYPREGTDLGVYQYGDAFLYDMPTDSAVILALEPAANGSDPQRPALPDEPERIVVPAFAAAEAPVATLFNWKAAMTIAPVKRDAQGLLLPLQSYDETTRRGVSFLQDDHLKWFKAADTLLDENGTTQMPWVYYSNLQHNGMPFPNSVDRFVSYPAFHHALLIKTFIYYGRYAGDERALKEAVKLADWDIAHSTPGDWAYGNLPYSTYEQKKPGGFRDKTGLMPDKAAILALAYLDLHDATDEARFLKAAEAIGHTLSQRQRPDGTWPFRVDPQTETVIEEYTSSVIYAIRLFEKLDRLNKSNTYKTCRDKTWNWLLNGPIKTKEFRGFYEDIPPSPQGRTNYDCLDTIRYLLANRTDDNGYLELAKDLNTWVEKVFMDKIKGFEPAEGIREQLQCNVVMGVHSLNWASMLIDLAEATGDEAMRQRAIQTANYITYYLQPDNRIVVGFQYNQWWYSCHAGVVLYLFDFAGSK